MRSCVCAIALAATICCIAIPVGALADENPSDSSGVSEEAQPSESSESVDPGANSDGENGGADNPSDGTDENVSEDADVPTDEDFVDNEELDEESSDQTLPEEDDLPEDDDADDSFVEEIEASKASTPVKNTEDKESNRDGTIEGKQKTPEEEALDKLNQANAIYDHMSRLAGEINELQARYDELKATNDKVSSRYKKTKEALEREQRHLNELKKEMSSHIVNMYKQGGVTPYLDVLCGAASYEEFLSLWYMFDKVAHYGEHELSEQVEIVKSLEAEMSKVDDKTKEAEKEMDKARAKLNRSWLTYLSLAPHAASLRMEAATMLGDNAGFASAEADYYSACAELNSALEQGLAEAGRLEGEGIFTNPCPDAVYSSGFGYRDFDNAYHLGLDMAIDEGTPYYAADDGVVIDATNGGGNNGGAGNWIVIDHGNGVVTKYMHSLVTFVIPGDTVMRGQNIGLVGNTGKSFGAHLHFQVEIDGVAVDPMIYL